MKKTALILIAFVYLGGLLLWLLGSLLLSPHHSKVLLKSDHFQAEIFAMDQIQGWYFPVAGSARCVLLLHSLTQLSILNS